MIRPNQGGVKTGKRRLVLAYVLGLASVAVIYAASPDARQAPVLMLFLFPVLAATYLGGIGPGGVTTAVATLASALRMSPHGALLPTQGMQLVRLTTFVALGATLSIVIELLRRLRIRAELAAELALKSEQQFARTFFSSPVAKALSRIADATTIEVNDAYLTTFGVTRAQIVGHTPAEAGIEIAEDAQRALQAHLAAHRDVRGHELEITSEGDQTCVVLLSSQQIEFGGEAVALTTFVDITARKLAEQAAERMNAQFSQLANAISEVFWLADVKTRRLIYISPGYALVWGRSCEELLRSQSSWLEAIHPDDRARVRAAIGGQREGTYNETYRILRPDGELRWIHDHAFPVHARAEDPTSEVVRIAGVARDITDQRMLEVQLRQTQKLESIGLLAGGIAHDFNNVLTAILAHAELMQLSLPEDHELQESIQTILSSGRRAAHLTRNLLSFSRRQIVSRRPIALQRIANGVANLVGPILREDITLSLELAASDVMVMADEAELEQIVMNLVTNARDAMPKGGKICISVGEFTVDDAFILAHGGGLLGKCAVLTVTDTGEGMSAETVEKIFEPFFTTKEAGRGTGLGLATTHSVVEEHGGKITVDSAPGKGTKMSIYLPLTAAVVAPSTALEAKAGARGNETILVAEDEEVVRSVISRLLRSHGYRVIEAVDGQDAIDKFRNESGHIDLVLTDMVMPRRSGLDIYDVVSGFRQGTKVIFTSGYAADVIDQKRVTEQHLQLLAKPVRPTVLLETIRRVLDDKTPPR